MKKKFLSALLVLAMVLSLLPVTALADDSNFGTTRVVAVANSKGEKGKVTAKQGEDNVIEVEIDIGDIDEFPPSVSGDGTGDSNVLAYWVGVGIAAPGNEYTKVAFKGGSSPNNFKDNGPLDEFVDEEGNNKQGFTIWLNAGNEDFKENGITYELRWTKDGTTGQTGNTPIEETYHITLVNTVTAPKITSRINAAPQAGNYAEDYSIKKTGDGTDYTTLTLTAHNVVKHKNNNGAGDEGYWVGVGFVPLVPTGESSSIIKVRYKAAGTEDAVKNLENITPSELEPDVNGEEDGIAFYVDAEKYIGKSLWIGITWVDENNAPVGMDEIYEINFDVTLKTDTSGGDNTGGDNTGGDNTGGDNTGGDNTGGDNNGGDNNGGDNTGGDNTGGDNTGGDNNGGDNNGGTDNKPAATQYTITFDPNGGRLTGDKTATTGTNGRLSSLPTPARSGYTFDGWYTSRSGGSRVTTNYKFTADTTIYARYSPIQYTFIPPQTQSQYQSQASAQASLPASAFTPVTWRPATVMWDVPASSWAYSAAQWAYQNGYLDTAADGTFHLDDSVSHLQMWRIMAKWLGEPALDEGSVNQWARQSGAARVGAASGTMTRQNMVEYLYQCYFLMGGDVSATGNLVQYRDSQLITSTSAKNAWSWAVEKGIISGTTDGYLNPGKVLSRGEFATILMKMCQIR